jgi:hypothetical protein
MALAQLGNDIASVFLGEVTGFISEWMTDRIRAHRGELGAGDTSNPGKMETLSDLALDSLVEIVFLLLGIKLTQRAVPAVSEDLSAMILFIIGISTQTKLPINLKKLLIVLQQQPDPIVVSNSTVSGAQI